jgi:hypothetical protein
MRSQSQSHAGGEGNRAVRRAVSSPFLAFAFGTEVETGFTEEDTVNRPESRLQTRIREWRAATVALADAIEQEKGLPEGLQLAALGLREAAVLVGLRQDRLPASIHIGSEPMSRSTRDRLEREGAHGPRRAR